MLIFSIIKYSAWCKRDLALEAILESDFELLISSEVDLEGFLLAAVVSSSVANYKGFESLAGSEPIFITDSTKNSYHVVVTVDKAHVNQTLPNF